MKFDQLVQVADHRGILTSPSSTKRDLVLFLEMYSPKAEIPTEKQMKWMSDIEKREGIKAPASAWRTKQAASTWLSYHKDKNQ